MKVYRFSYDSKKVIVVDSGKRVIYSQFQQNFKTNLWRHKELKPITIGGFRDLSVMKIQRFSTIFQLVNLRNEMISPSQELHVHRLMINVVNVYFEKVVLCLDCNPTTLLNTTTQLFSFQLWEIFRVTASEICQLDFFFSFYLPHWLQVEHMMYL